MAGLVGTLVGQQSVDAVTFHFYNIGGEAGAAEEAAKFLEPATLDRSRQATELAVAAATQPGSGKRLPVWLGETATASGGGLAGSSGTYTACFIFLDKLGSIGRWGGAGLMRQALFEGQYALLDPTSFAPRPTFWLAALFTKVAGPEVLRISGDSAANRTLRTYSRCAKQPEHPAGESLFSHAGRSIWRSRSAFLDGVFSYQHHLIHRHLLPRRECGRVRV